MAKPAASNDDFPIHVDGSCLTNSTDLHAPPKRNLSDQTVIHNEDYHEKTEQDEHTEALIHAAARAIITSIEQETYDKHAGSTISDLSYSGVDGTENCYTEGTELTYGEETELSYGDGTEMSYEGDHENSYDAGILDDSYDGSASSHHEDDVFSDGRRSSNGSLNSSDEQNTDEEMRYRLTKSDDNAGQVENRLMRHDGQGDGMDNEAENMPETISRIPSIASNAYSMLPEPMSFTSKTSPHTPSKVLNRPPFRTPSSVRAIQMSSPTPSVFSGSPTSRKRLNSSRLCTPNKLQSSLSKHRTPTKFKAKEEHPLVLLHVTVLPLQWQHSQLMDTAPTDVLSKDLLAVRESWKLLQEKLGDTVFERGVLLPHPQDSYETLEERLCAALELPMRPRAKILACGHYVGPSTSFSESELSSANSSDSEDLGSVLDSSTKSLWCDICCRDVRCGKFDAFPGRQRKSFKVKLFASNGLMGAGAWAACWREMERVDVEITPWVDATVTKEISELAESAMAQRAPDEVHFEEVEQSIHEPQPSVKVEAPQVERHADLDDAARRERDAERLREIYGEASPAPEQTPQPQHDRHSSRHSTTRHRQDESLISLLLAAAKVLMQDKKNVMIFLLSVVVVLLAIKPSGLQKNSFEMQELVLQKLQEVPVAQKAPDAVKPVVQVVAKMKPENRPIPEQAPVQSEAQIEVVERKRDAPAQAPEQAPVHVEVAEAKDEAPAPVPISESQSNDAVPASEGENVVEQMEPVLASAEVKPVEEPSVSSAEEENQAERHISHIEPAREASVSSVVPNETIESSKHVAQVELAKPEDEDSPSSIVLVERVESPQPIIEAVSAESTPKSLGPEAVEQVTAAEEDPEPKTVSAN